MPNNLKEIFFFAVSGTGGYVVDALSTALLGPYLGLYVGRIPAFFLAATTTWLINRNVTFKERGTKHKSIRKEYAHYLSLMVAGAIVNYVVYVIAITFLRDMPFSIYICVGIGSLAGMVVNFVTSKRYIYSGDDLVDK